MAEMGEEAETLAPNFIGKLEYLDSCMKETVRRYGMLMLVRKAMKDVAFTSADGRDFIIPKGRTVVSSPFLSHHNSEVYPEPSLYDPERFADPERKQSLVANRHYVQFGFGRHKCLVRSPSTTLLSFLVSHHQSFLHHRRRRHGRRTHHHRRRLRRLLLLGRAIRERGHQDGALAGAQVVPVRAGGRNVGRRLPQAGRHSQPRYPPQILCPSLSRFGGGVRLTPSLSFFWALSLWSRHAQRTPSGSSSGRGSEWRGPSKAMYSSTGKR
jgi:hypothetical protein